MPRGQKDATNEMDVYEGSDAPKSSSPRCISRFSSGTRNRQALRKCRRSSALRPREQEEAGLCGSKLSTVCGVNDPWAQ